MPCRRGCVNIVKKKTCQNLPFSSENDEKSAWTAAFYAAIMACTKISNREKTMTDFLELCKTRQSCRSYNGQIVEREKLERCLEAARLAPSACNSQPWSFVVVNSPELLPQVANCARAFNNINGFVEKAGAVILILEEHARLMPGIAKLIDSQYFAKLDIGGATLAICLEAADQGLGTCIIGLYDRPTLGKLLDIPEGKAIVGYIAVGYPADDDKIREKQRKPLADMVRFA